MRGIAAPFHKPDALCASIPEKVVTNLSKRGPGNTEPWKLMMHFAPYPHPVVQWYDDGGKNEDDQKHQPPDESHCRSEKHDRSPQKTAT